MSVRSLYVLALSATRRRAGDAAGARRPLPAAAFDEFVAEESAPSVERRLIADAVVAASDAEAKRAGLDRVLARCPPEEGWTEHEVTAAIVLREFLIDAVRATGERDEEDAPEAVM